MLWRLQDGQPVAVNFDTSKRARRQDREGEFAENGSIYIVRPADLRATGSRIAGRLVLYEMDFWSGFEVDTADDLELCELILSTRSRLSQQRSVSSDIRLLVLDFDGVMTDNHVLVSEDGREAVYCSRSDGHGLAQLMARGVEVLVLSAETNAVVQKRCEKLGIECIQTAGRKWDVLQDQLARRNIRRDQVVYVGNDETDAPCMAGVGLGVAPADAHPAALGAAGLRLTRRGGEGAVREVCDLILALGVTHAP
jgi:N-acylneuraminate cytidylyltransferase